MSNRPNISAASVLALGLAAVLGWSACRSSRDPAEAERLFAEAEALRMEYQQASSQVAIERYEAAMGIWARIGDTARAGLSGQRIGDTHLQVGAVSDALLRYRDALAQAEASADRGLESRIRSSVGVTLSLLGDHDEAAAQCARAGDLAEQFGAERERAAALNCLGESRYNRGYYDEALGSYQRAAELWERVQDVGGAAESRFFMGSSQSDLNEFEAAGRNLQEALATWKSLGNRSGEARAIAALGRLNVLQGKFQQGLEDYDAALTLLESIGDVYWQAICHMGIALVFYQTGEPQRTFLELELASRLHNTAGVPFGVIDAVMAMALTHLSLGEPDEAASKLERTLRLSREAGNRLYEADSLRYLGLTEQARGNPEGALTYLRQSLQMQESIDADPRLEAELRSDIGSTYEDMGDHDAAVENFTLALDLSHALQDRLGEATGRFNLARINEQRGSLANAQENIEAALDIAESLRTEVASQELRASFLASVHSYYELYVSVLMQLHGLRPDEQFSSRAFQVSERARARSLLESLNAASVDLRSGVDPLLLEREQQLREALNSAYGRQTGLSGESLSASEIETLDQDIRQLETQFVLALAQIRSRSPLYGALTDPEPLSLDRVQAEVLDAETILLEYALGDDRSYLWAVSKDHHASFELAPRSEIEEAARGIYDLLTARLRRPEETTSTYRLRVRDAEARYQEVATNLSQLLLGPVAGMLEAYPRVVVVADGALQYVPFSALPTPGGNGRPLLADHEIVNVPSASAIAVLRRATEGRPQPRGAVAVFADPVYEADDARFDAPTGSGPEAGEQTAFGEDRALAQALRAALRTDDGELLLTRLVETAREAATISAAAPAGTVHVSTGFDANRAQAMNAELADYRVIHFATHAVFNNQDAGLSGLILSTFDQQGQPQDGFLRLHDIYNLDLPVELVVLSACNTALGEQIRGEGLVGIVRGFMYAGSKRVVASLWKVDDLATGELMTRFYRYLLTDNLSPADALRRAQLSMLAEPQWENPFYWAGFVLQGEWRGY